MFLLIKFFFFLANPTTTFIAVLLLFIQCVRRFYETHFIQIFATTSKINITHYIVGYFHYFGAFLAIFSQASGFVKQPILTGPPHPILHSIECGYIQWLAIGIFVYAWYQQFISNLILVNLRKNESGKKHFFLY